MLSPLSGGRRPRLASFRPVPGILIEISSIAFPVMGTNVVSMLGFVVFAGMVSGMGTTIFAAHSIAVTAEELFYISGYGLRMSTSALMGLFTTSSPVRDMGGEHVGSADTVYLPCRACLASWSPGGMVLHDRVQCLQSGAPESAVYDRAV